MAIFCHAEHQKMLYVGAEWFNSWLGNHWRTAGIGRTGKPIPTRGLARFRRMEKNR
jgi:hypothetical protein